MNNLQDLIKNNPTVNITISGTDLMQFAESLATQTAHLTLANKEDKVYTRQEICKKFDISLGTLWRWDSKLNLISGTKIGRRIYYNESDVKNLINSKK